MFWSSTTWKSLRRTDRLLLCEFDRFLKCGIVRAGWRHFGVILLIVAAHDNADGDHFLAEYFCLGGAGHEEVDVTSDNFRTSVRDDILTRVGTCIRNADHRTQGQKSRIRCDDSPVCERAFGCLAAG